MNKNDLIDLIQHHLDSPQKSERWAMYRLIAPVVDFANLKMELLPFFEFNQTSEHKTSQSVDIALLEGDEPRVMVEAKRVDRAISAEQISKYLQLNVRGVVTNGVGWVMCLNDRSKAISICDPGDEKVKVELLDEIISFIRGEVQSTSDWCISHVPIKPWKKPKKLLKVVKAKHKSNPVEKSSDLDAVRLAVTKLSTTSELDTIFLTALFDQMALRQGFPTHLWCEIRPTRVAFFDSRITKSSKRVARIDLGMGQPDVLVSAKLVQPGSQLDRIASHYRHDKGGHMRRFRFSEGSEALAFGSALADVLSE